MKTRYEHEDYIDYYGGDPGKIAKASAILQITQQAGNAQMSAEKPTYDDLMAEGKAFMLSRLDLEVYETLHSDVNYVVSSWPCESQRATFFRNYSIEKDGRRLALISSYWVLVELETRRLLKVDDLDMSNYYIGPFEELHKDKFKIPKDMELHEVGKKEICYCDLDGNGHMNNTYYLDVLSNYIPELPEGTHRIKSVRLHYSKEAPFGDVITIFRGIDDEGAYYFKTVKASGEMNIACKIEITEL